MRLFKRYVIFISAITLLLSGELFKFILEGVGIPIPRIMRVALDTPHGVIMLLVGVAIMVVIIKWVVPIIYIICAIIGDFLFGNNLYRKLKETEDYWVRRASKSFHYGRGIEYLDDNIYIGQRISNDEDNVSDNIHEIIEEAEELDNREENE